MSSLPELMREHDKILEYLEEAEDLIEYRELRDELERNEAALREQGVFF